MSIETINPISPKPRMNPVAQYLLALAAVVVSYSVYVQVAVPFLEGAPQTLGRKSLPDPVEQPSMHDQKSGLAQWLPADAWELTACKTLLIDAGTILFKEIDRQPDGSLHIKPFTLISGLESDSSPSLGKDASSSKPPTVLRCLAGARLKFNKPLSDILSGNAKMESARLSGRVDIYRPPSQPERDDAVHVITSNVQVEKHRIFTLERIQFAFGPNQGTGRNMLIDLAHEEESSVLADFSSIAGIRRLELAFLDELRIDPSSQSDSSGQLDENNQVPPGQPGGNNRLFATSKSPLEVTCSGPFVFDFQSNTASFQKQVVARQLDAFEDKIECDELLLVFHEKPETPPTSGLADIEPIVRQNKSKQENKSGLELQQFIATGKPAVVTSRSQSARISGDQLSYNIITSEIEGSCEPSTPSMVTIVSPEYQMVAKQLSYRMTDDGSLGDIRVNGPGRILRAGGPDKDEFYSSWQTSLISRNVAGQPGLKRVVMDGAAQVRVADETSVAADRLELLVWQLPKLETTRAQTGKQTWEYLPSKLVTTGNVSIVSPKLDGQARQLTATWPAPNARAFETAAPIGVRAGYRGTLQHPSQDSNGNQQLAQIPRRSQPFRPPGTTAEQNRQRNQSTQPNGFVEMDSASGQAVHDPNVRAAGFINARGQQPEKPKQKLKFKGDSVNVRLTGTGDATEILDLTIDGNVSIESRSSKPTANEAQPMTIEGDKLQLSPQQLEKNFRVLVSAQPGKMARVTAKGLLLSGKNINLDQEANKLWIEGAGSMTLDLEASDQIAARGPATGPDDEPPSESIPENLDVKWVGGMIFDGTRIYFENDVEMLADRRGDDGNRTKTRSQSEGLSVELSQSVQFQSLQENKQFSEAKIKEMILVDQVPDNKQVFKLITHSPSGDNNQPVVIDILTLDSIGEVTEQQRIAVPQAVINVESGKFECKGPGTVAMHRLRQSGEDSSSDPFAQLANDDRDQPETGILFIQINFDGTMNIDSKRRAMKIDRNIRTVYVPVQNWNESFDPDRVRRRTPGSVVMTCDHLQMVQWTPRAKEKPTSELIAQGNTHILSATFEATADRVSYDKATDQLVIVGNPRNDAKLRLKRTPNDIDPTPIVARQITYRLKDKTTSVVGIKNIKIKNR